MEAIHLPERSTMRLQLAAILLLAWGAGFVTTWQLHQHGIQTMVLRWTIALAVVYAAFLVGVRIWLWLLFAPSSRTRGDSGGNGGGGGSGSSSGSGDSFSGGGGRSGGAGASSSWADGGSRTVGMPMPVESAHASSSSSSSDSDSDGGGGGGAIGGAGAFLVRWGFVLAVVAICAAVGYIIYIGPHMLGDAAFNFMLAAGLARQRHETWLTATVRSTWKPFMVILVATIAFAFIAASRYPHAHTVREVLRAAGWSF